MTAQLAKCLCMYCSGKIEFETDHAGESIICPHCQLETKLYVPTPKAPTPSNAPTPRPSRSYVRISIAIFATVLAAALGVAVWGTIRQILPSSGQVGALGAFLISLAIFLFIVWIVIMWVIFPLFVYYGIEKLKTLLTQIERNTRQ